MAGRFSVETIFKAVDRMSAPVSRMQNRVGKFTRSMSNGLRKVDAMTTTVTRGIKRTGLAIAAALAVSGGAMADVISTGATFEQTLVNAAAKFPGEIRRGTEAFEALDKAARHVGATTEFTASQSAEALNFLAMAGFNAEMSIAALPGVVDLATAASVDLATATDIATDSLGAFNLMTKDADQNQKNLARVSDVLARASVRTNTTVEAMFEAIKDGAPVATAAGQSMETVAAMIGVMANAGIKGTRGGTALKNIMLAMSAPTSAAAGVMKRLGIETTRADGSLRDAVDVFDDFMKVSKSLPEAKKMQAFNAIFGKIPIAAALNLSNSADALRSLRDELEGANGAATTMANVMRDTVQGRLNSLKSAIEGVKISIFSMNNSALSGAIDKMTEWVRANEELIATNVGGWLLYVIENLDGIIAGVKKVAIGIGVFLAFSAVLKTLVGILTLVNLAMALNPITWIVVGVIAAVAAFAALVKWVDQVAAKFDELPAYARLALAPIELLVRAIKFIKDNIGAVGDIASKVGSFVFGDDEDRRNVDARGRPQVVSPADRTASSIEERRETSNAEITIKDESGRAEVTKGFGRSANSLRLQRSGEF